MKTTEIYEHDPESSVASTLMGMLDDELRAAYPGYPVNGIDVSEFKAKGGVFLVAFFGKNPAGCGSFKRLDRQTIEIKRMYVIPPFRGRCISRKLLLHLETAAKERGFLRARLETGSKQTTALTLYRSAGYTEIPPFGIYRGNPHSICFEKKLS